METHEIHAEVRNEFRSATKFDPRIRPTGAKHFRHGFRFEFLVVSVVRFDEIIDVVADRRPGLWVHSHSKRIFQFVAE